jgi:23S rRNA (pseudouridine1915-N3)-methyltransferase
VALDRAGRAFDSEGFARHLDGLLARHACVAFLVGPAEGLGPEADALASERLCLTPMTLPHRLARLLLVEQIYRALAIQRGEPYHR